MARKKIHHLTGEDIRDIRYRVQSAIRKKLIPESERDDLEQELTVCLLQAVKQFNRRKGRWSTYRGFLLRTSLCDLLRRQTGPRSYEGRKANFSIEDPVPNEQGNPESLLWRDVINQDGVFADGTEKMEEYERLDQIIEVRNAIAAMPRHLQRLSRALMSGGPSSKTALAKRLHVSARTVFYWFEELKMSLLARDLGY